MPHDESSHHRLTRSKRCSADPRTDLNRKEAGPLIEQALEAVLGALLAQFSAATTSEGPARIVRCGHLPEREVMTGVGLSRER